VGKFGPFAQSISAFFKNYVWVGGDSLDYDLLSASLANKYALLFKFGKKLFNKLTLY
jgi:hypothetical protein